MADTAATISGGPTDIVWDITYACPLRCTHCYSESGRRAARQLSHDDMLRVTDALLSLGPSTIVLAGGEPLIVKGLGEIIDRITAAGAEVLLYTSGWSLPLPSIGEVVAKCAAVSVSLDGATAEVHDAIRGRDGSFDRAVRSLMILDDAVRERRRNGGKTFEFGLDATIVRSSFDQLDLFCEDLAPRFAELSYLAFGPAMPIGLGSRGGFVEHELLSDDQVDQLTGSAMLARLKSLAPPSVQVSVMDNRLLRYHPDLLAQGRIPAMQVEPDGLVRAMAIYEGTVGSLLTEPPMQLWRRSVERWSDPFVVDTLTPVHTMRQWAAATRRLDYHFGTDEDRARIDRRPVFLPLMPSR
ncbi:MoaA/NifB/PqqE/SkfB family radical SAM enzyme [Kibdelosporangium banguiense]|uniref:MoaA/NifB/PqqE/SkfB family radical SAM enzyme n=1 Tax=Kibdelosporangium banguiense TaxID=1365924 RepID=A0ABS4TWW5_9PSEU|nr:radical SAM protein [Kibdelosporangium banguiense]MBP2328421.1 MoaA/NifB/PqqE/SkfB family radical SAM enzyme [Kibdelosporangium banguiense]